MTKAWIEFYNNNQDIANKLISSDINFDFDFSPDAELGYTVVDQLDTEGNATKVNVRVTDDIEEYASREISYVLAHEIVHSYRYIIDPKANDATLYEEVIAMKFQNSFGQQIGYNPPTYPWNAIWNGPKMQMAQRIVERALKVDLSNEPSDKLQSQLKSAFKNTTYWTSGYYTYWGNTPKYWEDMNELEEVFINN